MNLDEIAHYAADLKATVLLAVIVAILAILYASALVKLRVGRGREAGLERRLVAASNEVARLEARVAGYVELEEGVEELKNEVRRADAIRGKTEERLREQNAEIQRVKTEAVDRMAELERLRKLVEHIEDL